MTLLKFSRRVLAIALLLVATARSLPARAESAPTIKGEDLLSQKEMTIAPKAKGEVILFMSSTCPCSNSHLPVVKKLSQDYPDYQFVVIHANADESVDQARAYFKKADLPFPVIQDQNSKLANELKALKTPHSYLVDAKGEIVYRGGVTSSASAAPTDVPYLRNALADLTMNRPVKVTSTRVLGCAIGR